MQKECHTFSLNGINFPSVLRAYLQVKNRLWQGLNSSAVGVSE